MPGSGNSNGRMCDPIIPVLFVFLSVTIDEQKVKEFPTVSDM